MTPSEKKPTVSKTLTWLPAKTFELEFSLPWKEVKKTYDEVLAKVAQSTTLKGFRKGKAPLKLVEKNLDKNKLYAEVLQLLLPQTYFASIKQHNLQPICDPKITPLKTEEAKDWQFKAQACEAPAVVLGDYQNKIKGLKTSDKIWLPGKDKKEAAPEKTQEQILAEIFKVLLTETKVELSTMLVEEEKKRMLGRLLEEIKKLGITLDDYLASNHKTSQQLQEEYQKTSEETLKLEFILQDIALKEKITVTDKEIQDLIATIKDQKQRENLQSPQQKAYISLILRKRKVVDFLIKL